MMVVPTVSSKYDLTFLALADPTRRAILDRLGQGEARVTELAQPFPISLNAVSKHIRMLERAGLVRRRRAGREHFLSANPAPLDDAAQWIEEHRAFWNRKLEAMLKEEDRMTTRSGTKPGREER